MFSYIYIYLCIYLYRRTVCIVCGSRERIVTIVTKLRAGWSGVQFLAGALDISSETSRPYLRPTQPYGQWMSVA